MKFYVIVWLLIAGLCTPLQARVIDRVIAVVNDEVITLSELEDLLVPWSKTIESIRDPIEKERIKSNQNHILLDELINQRLIAQEAKALRIRATTQEIDDHISRTRNRQGWSDEELRAYLKSQQIDYADYRTKVSDQLVQQKTMRMALGAKMQISDSDLYEYYKEKLTQTGTDFDVEAAQIFLPVDSKATAAEDAAAKQEITEIFARAKAGEDFASLARQYSRAPGAESGGSLGVVSRGSLPEFESILFTIDEGQIGGPLRSRYG